MLRYLAEREIHPGQRLQVCGREPFGGQLTVEIEGKAHALGPELAERMRVTELSKAAPR
jgi:Fe2+ transport system protein FeoA